MDNIQRHTRMKHCNVMNVSPFSIFFVSSDHIIFVSLSETCRGWKFWLTPPPSLRSKAHKVIWEILLYIRSQFAFKLGHANFPTCINCFHTTLYYLSAITKHAFPTLVVLKIPQIFTWVIFKDIDNGCHSLHFCGVYNT